MTPLCVLWLFCTVLHPAPIAIEGSRAPAVDQPAKQMDALASLRARGFAIDVDTYPSKVRGTLVTADLARWSRIVEALDLRCSLTTALYKPTFNNSQWQPIKVEDRAAPIRLIPSLARVWSACAEVGASSDDGVYSADGVHTSMRAPRVHSKFYDGRLVDPGAMSPLTPIPSFLKGAGDAAIAETWRVVGPGPALNELRVDARDPNSPPIRGRCSVEQFAPFIWMLDVTEIGTRNGAPSESQVFHDVVFPVLDGNGLPREAASDPRASERHGRYQNLVTSSLTPRLACSQLPLVAPVPVLKQSGAPTEEVRWQERIVIPASLLAASGNRLYVIKATSWAPLCDDVVIAVSPERSEDVLQVVVGADIFDDQLIDLLLFLSKVEPTPELRAKAMEAVSTKPR